MLQEASWLLAGSPLYQDLRKLPNKSLHGFSHKARLALQDEMRAIDDDCLDSWLELADFSEARCWNEVVLFGLNVENGDVDFAESRPHIATENSAQAG